MIICVTSKGEGLEARFEEKFGRAPYFVLVDGIDGSVKSVENPYKDGSGGVGPRAAQLIKDNRAGVLITGRPGGNAAEALSAAGIEVYGFSGDKSVGELMDDYRAGKLSRLQ